MNLPSCMDLDAKFASLFDLYRVGETHHGALSFPAHAAFDGFAFAYDSGAIARRSNLARAAVQSSGEGFDAEDNLAILAIQRKLSPSRSGSPETGKCFAGGWRRRNHRLLRSVVEKAAERKHGGPGRHRTRIVMSALRFIPGIAFLPIETAARAVYNLHALVDHSPA